MRASFAPTRYEPDAPCEWGEARERFYDLTSESRREEVRA